MKTKYKKITLKDIMEDCQVSKTTASRILQEIKSQYPKAGHITYFHLEKYLSIEP